MDEHNFQQELHALKQRVSDLSLHYLPQNRNMSQLNSNFGQDPFFAQLDEVKAHVTSMESSMREWERAMLESYAVPPACYHNAIGNEATSSQQSNITLPSGPLFWRLFNSLRSDMRTLDSRVADVEQNVSDLEDRVDALDPNRFTPPGSTANSEVGVTQPLHDPNYSGGSTRSQAEMASELYTDAIETQGCLPIPTEQPAWPANTERQNSCSCILQQYQQRPNLCNVPQPQTEPFGSQSAPGLVNTVVGRLNIQNIAMESQISKLAQGNENLLQAVQTLTHGLDRGTRYREPEVELPARSRQHAKPEGVLFRDREIDRMDEQLQIAHERLRSTEKSIVHKDFLIEQLRSERDNYDATQQAENVQRKERIIQHYRQKLAAKDMEIYDLQDQIAERNHALRGWEESWNQMEDENCRLSAQAKADEDSSRKHIAKQKEALDRVAAEHAEEMEKVRDFIEQKDAVIERQEEVIARGAKLLEERDESLSRAQRRLRAVEDDREHAERTQERVSRLLSERDAEVAQLKGEAKSTRPKRSRSESREACKPANDQSHENAEPSAAQPIPSRSKYYPVPPLGERVYPSTVTSFEAPPSEPQHFPIELSQPQPPPAEISEPWVQVGESALQFQRLPHGERRAYVWDNSAREQTRGSEQPAENLLQRSDRRRRGRVGGRNARQSYRHYPELENQRPNPTKLQERGARETETQENAGSVPSEQGRQAFDDTPFYPPLPAPVTARRMASAADLRYSSHNNHMNSRRGLSKHQSLQELPKRRLQAYVETEGESGEERGREV